MRLLKTLVFSLVCLVTTASATLTIHITQGVDKPYPIAIVPFQATPLKTAALPQGFTHVIVNDLSNSGRFKVLPDEQLPQRPHTLDGFNWSVWQKADTGVDYAVVGQLQPTGSDRYNVSFELLTLYAQRPLVGQLFSNIPATRLRALAHHISDLIYQAITGQRGVFSTRLAYVDVLNLDGPAPVYRLIVADADGFNARVLLSQTGIAIASPTWSHNGQDLAYVTYVNNRMAIYEINVATGQRQLLVNYPGINSAPAFSPNDQKLAVALSMGLGADTNIYVLNLKTNKLSRLTSFANNTSPAWAPDGQSIVFNSDRSGSPQLYELNLQTHQVTRLTYDGVQNFDPHFTPNGQSIVFMHQETSGGSIQIARMNLATGAVQVISNGSLDKSPSVAPNGQMVIYAAYQQMHGGLAEVSIDGKVHLSLPSTEGSVQSPAWSPFL